MRPRKARSAPSTRSRSTTSAPRCGMLPPRSTGPAAAAAKAGSAAAATGAAATTAAKGHRPAAAAATRTRGRQTRPAAAVTPTNRPSNNLTKQQTDHPRINRGALLRSTTMAKPPIRKPKKKVCVFCQERISYVDYKDTGLLRKYISDRGKIRARRVSGNCTRHQRDGATAVKNAREMALLPYTSTAR